MLPFLEEVVALVVDDDEGRKILDVDLPHRLHAQLWEVQYFDLFDAVAGQHCGGPADGAQVEAPMFLARGCHLLAAVPLGKHHHAAAVRLERVDVRVHAPRRCRAETPAGHARRGLRGARVINGVVLDVIRQALPGVDFLLQLRVRDVPGDDDGPRERKPCLDRVLLELGQYAGHGLVQVHLDDVPAEVAGTDFGQILRGVRLKLFEEDAVLGDFRLRLPVRAAGDSDGHGARSTVPGQADDPHVVAKVLAAELRADAHVLGQLFDLRLEFQIPECPAMLVAAGVEVFDVLGAGILDSLERHLG
mmetsp:Transcript_85111/g.260059  ORF Transcript_85111/g.260059 Transcript_85111/m.260059 type:complete len:304 (-) Transcript_85111:861-1772(-)